MKIRLDANESFTQICEDGKMKDELGGSNDAVGFPKILKEHEGN